MSYILMEKNTPIVIYGASARGYYYKEKLEKQGFSNFIAFIDRNAENIAPRDELAIYTLEAFNCNQYVISKIVVIVTISNRFNHKEIVVDLIEKGFETILYQQEVIESDSQKKLQIAYENLFNVSENSSLEGFEIPKYMELINHNSSNEIIIKVENKFVSTYIPAELLFGLSVELFNEITLEDDHLRGLVPDKNIYYFNISYELLESFYNGIDPKSWGKYLKTYIKTRNNLMRKPANDLSDLSNHIVDRYEIYQAMEKKFCINPNFFVEYPADVKWNNNGYFNIEDGNNRVSFLISKGRFIIPCRISKDDYDFWLNSDILRVVKDYMKVQSISDTKLPILHPAFMKSAAKEESFSHKKAFEIGRWLGKRQYIIENIKVLDIECNTGFFGQFFSRMGAKVTALESNQDMYELCGMINKLSYTENIELFNSNFIDFQFKEKYKISIIARELLHDKNINLLKKIDQITDEILITEIEWKSNIDKWIIKETKFKKCHVLKTLPLYDKIYKLCLFLK